MHDSSLHKPVTSAATPTDAVAGSPQQPEAKDGHKHKSARWVGLALKYALPMIVSIGLCYLLFTGMDFKAMWRTAITECRPLVLFGAMGLSILSNVIRGARWQIQLRALGVKATLWELTLAFFGTYAVNLVFPRLGEFWRTGWIAKRRKAEFSTVFGSMVADRLTDTISVALMALASVIMAGPAVKQYLMGGSGSDSGGMASFLFSPWALAIIVAIALLATWAWVKHPENRIVKKAKNLFKGMWRGFIVIGKMPGLGLWLVLTVALWACYCAQFYMELMSFPLTAEAVGVNGFTMVFVLFVMTSLSMGVPSNGGIGPWQWALIIGLAIYSDGIPGLTRDYTTSFANFIMGAQTLLLIVLGLFTFACIALMKKPSHVRQNRLKS